MSRLLDFAWRGRPVPSFGIIGLFIDLISEQCPNPCFDMPLRYQDHDGFVIASPIDASCHERIHKLQLSVVHRFYICIHHHDQNRRCLLADGRTASIYLFRIIVADVLLATST